MCSLYYVWCPIQISLLWIGLKDYLMLRLGVLLEWVNHWYQILLSEDGLQFWVVVLVIFKRSSCWSQIGCVFRHVRPLAFLWNCVSHPVGVHLSLLSATDFLKISTSAIFDWLPFLFLDGNFDFFGILTNLYIIMVKRKISTPNYNSLLHFGLQAHGL